MLPVLCIVGRSRTDVASVIKGLLQDLADKEVRVAVITQAEKAVPLDSISSDVARFVAAGSGTVIVCAPGLVTTLQHHEEEPSLDELVWGMRDEYDLILVNGFRHSSFPKVEVHHVSDGEELICHKNELLAIVGDKPAGVDIPTFDDSNLAGLAELTRKRFLVAEPGEDAALFIDGVRLPLAMFVRQMVAGIVLGMVRTLKGVEDPKSVVVTVKTRK